MSKNVYCDHAATSPVFPQAVAEMSRCMTEVIGNPSSIHHFGRLAKEHLEQARVQVAELINAPTEEIYFTSGGTEADNLAILGVAARFPEGGHVITTPIEHSAVAESCAYLAEHGFDVTYLPVNSDGLVNPADVKKSLRQDTRIVSVMQVNNEVGTIEPVEEIGKIVKESNALFHVDAVQSVGHIEVDVAKIGCDLLSYSSHKINGPKGVGALYCKKGTAISRRAFGGSQEQALRSGTENLPGIVGMGCAAAITKEIWQERTGTLGKLRDHLMDRLLTEIPYSYVNGSLCRRVSHNLHVSFAFIEGEALLLQLDRNGIGVSSGSACSAGSGKPSRILTAMNLPPERFHAALRITLGEGNTMEEMDYVADVLADRVSFLRTMSPFTPKDCPCLKNKKE